MLRRKPGATSTLDGVDLKLLEGVDAGLTWSALMRSAPCESDEAAMRILRLLQQGHIEGKPGEDSAPAVANLRSRAQPQPQPRASTSVQTALTVPPSGPLSPVRTAVTLPPAAASNAHTAVTRSGPSLPSAAGRVSSPPRAPSAPSPTSPGGKTVPPTAAAAREALLRELALRRTSTSYPPARPSQPAGMPSSSNPPPGYSGYYSMKQGEDRTRGASSVPPTPSLRPAESNLSSRAQPRASTPGAGSTTPPGRYSVQPELRGSSSTPPGVIRTNLDAPLAVLMEELAQGTEQQRWCAARLRDAQDQDAAGQVQQAIASLQAVMGQITDPRVRVERDRLQARSLKATSGVYRARALTEERACKHKEAAESWTKVLEATPDDAEAALHAASCWMESGDIRQAGVFARRAVELAPKSVTAHRLLLRFFRKTGMELNANREREILKQLGGKG